MTECELARGHANRHIRALPASGGATVAATDADECVSLYTWRHDAEGGAGAGARPVAPRMVTLAGGVESFAARQILPHSNRHVLVVASGERNAGVVAEWDCEREKTRGDFALAMASTDDPVRATSIALQDVATGDAGATVAVYGVNASMLFRATLDRRAPGRTLLVGAGAGSAAALAANAWRYDRNAGYTCVATTPDGRAVIGSERGRVALVRELGARAALTFDVVRAPVRALHVTPDGAWVVATYDDCVLVVGPLERAWQHETHASVAHAVCTLSAERQRAHGVPPAAVYRGATVVGYSAVDREDEACVVVALAHLLLSFPLRRRSKRATRTSMRAAAAADAESIHALLKILMLTRIREPDAPLRCEFEHCTVYEAAAPIVDHVPRDDARGDVETLALETRLLDLAL